MKNLFIILLLLLSIPTIMGCSSTSEPDKTPIDETMEWEKVNSIVQTILTEADPPITNLMEDTRIDWENCANRPDYMTRNMTDTPSLELGPPLIAITKAGTGSKIFPVSRYLGKDMTERWYWIDRRGLVHLAE